MAKKRWPVWVGTKKVRHEDGEYSHYLREVFRFPVRPDDETHSGVYDYITGPFETVRGGKFAVHCGWVGNPHYIDVAQCEKLGKEYDETMRKLPKTLNRRL
jgi:hypothetical protein